MSYRVLITDYMWPTLDIERGILGEIGAELVVAEQGTPEELTALAEGVDAILTNWKKVPPAALDAAPGCVVVSRYGVGVDNIPVDHATSLGIMVVNVPDFCLDEVSDHAMALLLACARRIVPFARATRAGTWDLLGGGRGLPRLRGQQLGLIGYGNIARALVPKAQGFGLEVVAYTPRLEPGVDASGVRTTNDLGELLAGADYVSLHLPATPESAGMIGEAALRAMKPTAYLINTSRGALVDEAALERALRECWIAGAGLDVMTLEPPAPDHPLLALDTVVATPHAAFYSEPAIAELATKASRNVVTALRGEVPATLLNRGVLEQPNLRLRR